MQVQQRAREVLQIPRTEGLPVAEGLPQLRQQELSALGDAALQRLLQLEEGLRPFFRVALPHHLRHLSLVGLFLLRPVFLRGTPPDHRPADAELFRRLLQRHAVLQIVQLQQIPIGSAHRLPPPPFAAASAPSGAAAGLFRCSVCCFMICFIFLSAFLAAAVPVSPASAEKNGCRIRTPVLLCC